MNVVVCVGNCCHSKGACTVINGLQELIQDYHLEDVAVSASYCTGHCTPDGVSVQIDEEFIDGVTAGNLERVFKQYVLKPAVCVSKY